MKKILIVVIVLSSLVSCTVTKRVHNTGFHVQWNSNHKKVNSDKKAEKNQLFDEHKVSDDMHETDDIIIEYSPTLRTTKEIIVTAPQEKQLDKNFEKSLSKELISEKNEVEKHAVLTPVIEKIKTKKLKSVIKEKERKVKIDWDTVGFVVILLFLGTLVALALFAASPLAQIAAITLAILGLAMIIAAVCLIGWFFWFILFGWWM